MLAGLAIFAIAGQVLLLASGWLLPLVSEYGLVGDNISELVLGRYGAVQTIAFVIAGAGILGLAVALHRLTNPSTKAVIGSMVIGVWGAGAILSAIFHTSQIDDPADVWSQPAAGTVHVIVSLVSFPSVIAAMFLFAWAFTRQPQWQSLNRPSGILAGAALSLLFVQGEGPLVGILQRALVTVISSWLILVAHKVHRLTVRTPSLSPA